MNTKDISHNIKRDSEGINDNVAMLTTCIYKNGTVIGIFLDIKVGYDDIYMYKLYEILKDMEIPDYLNNTIFNFISQ